MKKVLWILLLTFSCVAVLMYVSFGEPQADSYPLNKVLDGAEYTDGYDLGSVNLSPNREKIVDIGSIGSKAEKARTRPSQPPNEVGTVEKIKTPPQPPRNLKILKIETIK